MFGSRLVGYADCGEINAGVGEGDSDSGCAMSNGACNVLAAVGSALGTDVETKLSVGVV